MSLLLGATCIAIGAFGYWLYLDHNRSGVELNIGGRTLTLETR